MAESEAFAYVDGSNVRLGDAGSLIPYCPFLQRAARPEAMDIIKAAKRAPQEQI